ncbi:MAG: hypothetical protein M3024_11495, partial [Candidatus Dormibacteraeota bacterium]|nr:hypothetical protein [Candidatus Dormibacteraeota bacterium]
AFKPGVGFLAMEGRTPVIPMHVGGSHRIMPKGRRIPLPGPATVRIGRPLTPRPGETSRAFTGRVETAVRGLARGSSDPALVGGWIDRWRAGAPARRADTGGRRPG